MSANTKIEWCDATFNPWIGCTKVSPGCAHCYAENMNNRFQGGNWGVGAPRRRTSAANWKEPLKWNRHADLFRECRHCGWRGQIPSAATCPTCGDTNWRPSRRRVFCASMADWLDNEVSIELLADLLELIRVTPNLDWLMLTKRVSNWQKRMEHAHAHTCAEAGFYNTPTGILLLLENWLNGDPPKNAWLGATVCNQDEADRDIPKLLAAPARVRFFSIEPMLGPITLRELHTDTCELDALTGDHGILRPLRGRSDARVHWVISGGESGAGARPSHPDWFRQLRDQCRGARVPFFMKQMTKKAPIPNDLLVRQFPDDLDYLEIPKFLRRGTD